MYQITIIITEENEWDEVTIQLPIIPDNGDRVWCQTSKHEDKSLVEIYNRCFNLNDDNIFEDISFDGKYA